MVTRLISRRPSDRPSCRLGHFLQIDTGVYVNVRSPDYHRFTRWFYVSGDSALVIYGLTPMLKGTWISYHVESTRRSSGVMGEHVQLSPTWQARLEDAACLCSHQLEWGTMYERSWLISHGVLLIWNSRNSKIAHRTTQIRFDLSRFHTIEKSISIITHS